MIIKKLKIYKNILPIFTIFMLTLLSAQHGIYAENNMLVPGGTPIGIAIYSKGVLVTGTEEVLDVNGISKSAAREAGIKKGDVILSANDMEVNTNEELSSIISKSTGSIAITAQRNDYTFNTNMIPIQTESGNKAGMWVRDSTAGIGTMTWYNPSDNTFAALGHGISDSDTFRIFSVNRGDVFKCNVTGAAKGTKGFPGELNGIFENKIFGSILKNTQHGVFGTLSENTTYKAQNAVPIASKTEVSEGAAIILCDVDGKGTSQYAIQILKTDAGNAEGKNLIIKVCDENLIEKTGGIVQGMSGSPILQNGRLVGAVTHVFLNNPLKGYGIFIENMIAEEKKSSN